MFLADENIDRQIVERLRQEGYDVVWIAELAPGLGNDDVRELGLASNGCTGPGTRRFRAGFAGRIAGRFADLARCFGAGRGFLDPEFNQPPRIGRDLKVWE